MSDQSRILLAIGGLVLGLGLGTVGTWLLGTARAIARHAGTDRRRRADLGQYAAALAALVGFLLTAGGAGLLTATVVPWTAPVRLFVATVTGVLVFTLAGVGFSRVADAAEDARVRRMPPLSYPPRQVATGPALSSPAVPSGGPPTVPGPTTAPPSSGPPSSGLPSRVPAASAAVGPTPSTSAHAAIGAPAATTVESAAPDQGGAEHSVSEHTVVPEHTVPEHGIPEQPDAAAHEASVDRGAGAEPAAAHQREQQGEHEAEAGSEPDAQDGAAAPEPAAAPHAEPGAGDEAEGADEGSGAQAAAAEPERLLDAEALRGSVRPGWIYRDEHDGWYLGVGEEDGHDFPLLRLPEFTLVGADMPAYPLTVVGAGEIAVVPLDATSDDAETSTR